MCKMF